MSDAAVSRVFLQRTPSLDRIRLGIVGLGNMGATHAGSILAGKINHLEITADFGRASRQAFARPETASSVITPSDHGGQHNEVLQNFVDAILDGKTLVAPAAEGLRSVELGNAMLLSTWLDKTVELPFDAMRYERRLQQRIKGSRFKKKTVAPVIGEDFTKSFRR